MCTKQKECLCVYYCCRQATVHMTLQLLFVFTGVHRHDGQNKCQQAFHFYFYDGYVVFYWPGWTQHMQRGTPTVNKQVWNNIDVIIYFNRLNIYSFYARSKYSFWRPTCIDSRNHLHVFGGQGEKSPDVHIRFTLDSLLVRQVVASWVRRLHCMGNQPTRCPCGSLWLRERSRSNPPLLLSRSLGMYTRRAQQIQNTQSCKVTRCVHRYGSDPRQKQKWSALHIHTICIKMHMGYVLFIRNTTTRIKRPRKE